MNVRTWPVLGVVFAVIWLFVRGVDLTVDAVLGQFLFGLAIGLPLAFVFRRLYAPRVDLERTVRGLPYVGLYVLAFGYELVRANLDVAYRVLAPGMPLEPEVILIPLRVRTEAGITVIANSITITPGTVTLDHDPEANALYVHVIDGRDPEAVVAPIRRWEDYALVLFDEGRGPDEPAPAITVEGPEANRVIAGEGEVPSADRPEAVDDREPPVTEEDDVQENDPPITDAEESDPSIAEEDDHDE